ncbi:MAG: hypothetical protein A2X12_04550 [Bacteroidetes bacterium GWE2_29_8]|nr:MAG: hypothetical protein A2X12_04550 [Bacteroidetes bacterium GWE2_29_8]OFY14444.1 MAG: hypothetical protein A2X02_01440 [Bacteroidetes bacterium GWF2_29_10]
MDIGNIIYVLVFIAVLVIKAYESNKKKQKKVLSKQQNTEGKEINEPPTTIKKIEDIFKEIFNDGSNDDVYESEEQEVVKQTIPESNQSKPIIKSEKAKFSYDDIAPEINSYETSPNTSELNNMEKFELDEMNDAIKKSYDNNNTYISGLMKDFDIKKAFIYSQIFERKY